MLEKGRDNDAVDNIESGPLTKQGNQYPRKQLPRWWNILYYLCLCTTALLLTMLAKGTLLWDTMSPLERGKVRYGPLIQLLLAYFSILFSFAAVQGTNPGYITKDVMDFVCVQDGLDLVGCSNGQGGDDDIYEEATASLLPQNTIEIEMTRRKTNRSSLMLDTSESCDELSLPSTSPLDEKPITVKKAKTYFRQSDEPYQKSRRKFCQHCEIAPPLRSHHCKICQKCVATFDHHCGFIGTCIGERNHCRFWWFLTFQTFGFINCVNIVGSSSHGFFSIIKNSAPLEDAILVILSKLYLYPLAFASIIMWVLNTWFAATGNTNFEMAKGAEHLEYLSGTTQCDLPFSKGIFENIKTFCCYRNSMNGICRGASVSTWTPILWKPPGKMVRDSDDWWEHPWQNKYWSCC